MPRRELPLLGRTPADLRSRQIFRREARRIREGYLRRLGRVGWAPPWNNANGYLKREMYRLVRHFHGSGQGASIERIVRDRGREPRSPTYDQNRFHWGFLALEAGNEDCLAAPDRRKFANELLYADRHNVPEIFLIGFIYQLGSGPSNIYDRVASGRLSRLARWIGSGR